jgi:UDP-N-acetylglucosamine 2-epimerase (non-hydrolysing)
MRELDRPSKPPPASGDGRRRGEPAEDAKARIVCIIGTRPEAIKMAPVILKLRQHAWARVLVVATAQHRDMADDVLDLFGIVPDIDLDLMQPGQTLSALTARCLTGLDAVIADVRPDAVMAQGDTTSVMAAATTCFYRRTPFLHVEAGLRSFDIAKPFPEEFNRIVASRVATLHFAPTENARANLLREGVPDQQIVVTGNTIIDALHWVAARNMELPLDLDPARRLLLVTVHRRENFGEPLRSICAAVRALIEQHPDIEVLWPVHPNPSISAIVGSLVGGDPRIHLVRPLPYGQFVGALKRAHLVLTDSGGVQEEAPALGRRVLVLRRETERPEGIEAGVARLVGTERDAIVRNACELLGDRWHDDRMGQGVSPYGDGHASGRIAQAIHDRLGSWRADGARNGPSSPGGTEAHA